MASKKKAKKKMTRKGPRRDDVAVYSQFIADLLSGGLGNAVKLYESRNSHGELELEYDEEVDE